MQSVLILHLKPQKIYVVPPDIITRSKEEITLEIIYFCTFPGIIVQTQPPICYILWLIWLNIPEEVTLDIYDYQILHIIVTLKGLFWVYHATKVLYTEIKASSQPVTDGRFLVRILMLDELRLQQSMSNIPPISVFMLIIILFSSYLSSSGKMNRYINMYINSLF